LGSVATRVGFYQGLWSGSEGTRYLVVMEFQGIILLYVALLMAMVTRRVWGLDET
jgi:hypothetical protein